MAERDTDERQGQKDMDAVREGSRLTCPHCGKGLEVKGGKMHPLADRSMFDQAVKR
jgi:hypothetical protein